MMRRKQNLAAEFGRLLIGFVAILAMVVFPKATEKVAHGIGQFFLSPIAETVEKDNAARAMVEQQRLKSSYEVEVRRLCADPLTSGMKACSSVRK
jgi:uncharacterized protein involved in cysteine biosynthesis